MFKDLLREFINFRKAAGSQSNSVSNVEEGEIVSFLPDGEQWHQFLKFVSGNQITEKQLEELIGALGGKEDTTLVQHVKMQIENDCDYTEDIRKAHPKITATELQICCYIIQGKSSQEMGDLMGVAVSTITSIRCRLRTKLGIAKGRNLKVYLDSISRLKRERLKKKELRNKSNNG